MELRRLAAASTYVTFPMLSTAGVPMSGLTVTGKWIAWSDTSNGATPGGATGAGNGFKTLTGAFPEIVQTGVYGGFLAATELPASSPYVLLSLTGGSTSATQYLLINTASAFVDVRGISGSAIASPVTAGYMPVDVKQTISLNSPADNSMEKSLSRVYFGTAYLNASVSSRSAPGTAQTVNIDSSSFAAGAITAGAIATNAIGADELAADAVQAVVSGVLDADILGSYGTDNTVGLALRRLYFATAYIAAAGSTYADDLLGRTLTRGVSGGRTVGQALMALRNKVSISAGTLTVTSNDDSTSEWTATIATQAVSAIVTSIDPA